MAKYLEVCVKLCTKCEIKQSKDNFNKDRTRKDGLFPWCRVCKTVSRKDEYEKNKETYVNYYKRNREYILKDKKNYRDQNREYYLEYNRNYRKDKKESIKEYSKDYYKKNVGKIREYERKRLKEDVEFKLAKGLRSRIRSALKNGQKRGSAVRDLGCSIEQFRMYLEEKFDEKMSWENYGYYGWHIDHVKPLVRFDLTDQKQFLEACHYTNMQPLWAKDNWAKGIKIKDENRA